MGTFVCRTRAKEYYFVDVVDGTNGPFRVRDRDVTLHGFEQLVTLPSHDRAEPRLRQPTRVGVPQRVELTGVLRDLFPIHFVYCDLMRRSFLERYSRDLHTEILGIGASFSDMTEAPENLFTDSGYKPLACTSIPLRAARQGALGVPPFVIRWFLGTLRRGYCVWKFGLSET